jgi:hypothetical protein
VHALHWHRSHTLHSLECRRGTSQLLRKLARVIKENQSFGSSALHLFVPTKLSSSALENVTELFKTWKERHILKLTYVKEDDYQINSRDFVRRLL